jgi:uncharacterized protein (TIRG00374 family)
MALPIGLSLAALAALLYLTYEPGAFTLMWAALRPGILALAVVALVAQEALGALRLRWVSGGRIPFRKGVRAQLTWDFLSAITPAAVGGGPLASVFIARENRLTMGEATGLMLFVMLMDQAWFVILIPTLLLGGARFRIFPEALGNVGGGTLAAFYLGMLGWAAFFAYATLIRPEVLSRVAHAVVRLRWLRRHEGRVREELQRLRRQARVLRGRPPGFFAAGVAFSAAMWACRYLVMLFVVWSVVPGLDVVKFLLRAGAMWLAAMALPTPGGSGGIEGLYFLFFEPLLPEGFVAPTLLTWRLLAYYLILAVGFGATWGSLGRMIRTRAERRAEVEHRA